MKSIIARIGITFRWMINLFWQLVFWWKKRTGWLEMGKNIKVTGTIVALIPPDIDGDACFNLKLDAGFEKYITLGDRLTTENDADGPSIHCEIPPWSTQSLRDFYKTLKVGDRVSVNGAWGFDGVHTSTSFLVDLFRALVRHQPNMKDGWFEVHPVTEINRL